jgi:hypothetical protein
MIKRVLAILAALVIGAVSAGGGVALAAKHHPTHHKAAHKSALAKRAAAEGETPGTESSEESEPGDGPGGHEDEPGGEVDHQFEGEE